MSCITKARKSVRQDKADSDKAWAYVTAKFPDRHYCDQAEMVLVYKDALAAARKGQK